MLSRTTILISTFDTIDHYILSIGLNAIRLQGQFHSWFMFLFHLEHIR